MSETREQEWKIGDRVTWLRQERGGYGYVSRIPGIVRKVGGTLVRIEVPLRDGSTVIRRVRPESLRFRTPDTEEQHP